MRDFLVYELNGYEHKQQVNDLQRELTEAFGRSENFPIRRLLELLPIRVSAPGRVLARGDIIWINNSSAKNEYDADQVIELGDPALGKFYLSIPKLLRSAYTVGNAAAASLTFKIVDDDFVVQLNKLVEEGFNRSAYQVISELIFQRDKFTSVLVDQNDREKITHLVVLLTPDARLSAIDQPAEELFSPAAYAPAGHTRYFHVSALDDKCCEELTPGANWYVFRRRGQEGGQSLCVEHEGTTIEGGSQAWEQIGGPFNSREEAVRFSETCGRCL